MYNVTLGTITLETFTSEPFAPCRNLCLVTFTFLPWKPSLGNVYSGTLQEPVPCNFGNLGNLVGTFVWQPLLANFGHLHLGIFTLEPSLGNFYN